MTMTNTTLTGVTGSLPLTSLTTSASLPTVTEAMKVGSSKTVHRSVALVKAEEPGNEMVRFGDQLLAELVRSDLRSVAEQKPKPAMERKIDRVSCMMGT